MRYEDFIPVGSPVVVRCYVSGIVVGRLAGGEGGTVALTDWRWLRRWSLEEGSEGSVYDLVAHPTARPDRRGPLTKDLTVLQQADVMMVTEEVYQRLAGD